ncbi:MAG: lipid-A-disaccharide synthase N-terminal domain-containing protein [Phycisphaerae bacterium]
MLIAAGALEKLLEKMSEPLVWFGLLGQVVFMLRFVVQWFQSERAGRSVVPVAFWYLSIVGGGMLLVYGIIDVDPVIILGQSLGMAIYIRNLVLIHREKNRIRNVMNG